MLLALPFAVLFAFPSSGAFFDLKVRPVLVTHCFKCHSAEAKSPKGGLRLDTRAGLQAGGDSGPAVVPGKPAASLLVKAVRHAEGVAAMPPKGRLTPSAIADIEKWIAAGAIDPRPDPTAGQHWAFVPPSRPEVPGDNSNPIDAFIRAKLAEEGLSPSPVADRRTLIRRITFDLTGLPPTPEEVAAFLKDQSPDAYEKLVDRLLASPRYGERFARHWLDVVRFAESNGFETNLPRPNAWRYRDWVIKSLNEDLPYDQFAKQQLAGDALGADVATGFLVAGPWDAVKSPDPVLTAQQRADELHDVVSVTGSAFLGLTVGCARCHNHKFDPISHTDYHALTGIFAGVQHGERLLTNDPGFKKRQSQAETLQSRLADLDRQLAALEPRAEPDSTAARRPPVSPRQNTERFAPVSAAAVRFTAMATTEREPCLDELEVFTTGPRSRNAALDPGVTLRSSGNYPPSSSHRLEHLIDGRYGNGRSWIASQVGKGWVEVRFPSPVVIDRIVWGRDREGKFTDRLAIAYRIEVETEDGERRLVASSDDRAAKGQAVEVPRGLPGLLVRRLRTDRAATAIRLSLLGSPPAAYAGQFTTPGPVRRFHRGDPTQPREPVAPGALTSVGPKLQLSPATPEQKRRLALADWITDPANPLTARVIVNRLWQTHFGTGLVETPSDFGKNGSKPSHPELLDWLACELMSPQANWRLKHIHRLIVTSDTYKQSSRATSQGMRLDAGSRLLWRYPPRRLEAEAIRDSILAASGKLDLAMGGPGFDLFEPNSNYVKVYTPKTKFGPDTFRRMIYWSKPRMQLDSTFGAFDCPDAGQIAPKRNISTTPLQALNLLNSPFLVQQAGYFAGRLQREAGEDAVQQVRRGFELAFQREPTAQEEQAAVKLVRKHGLEALARALFNANEFVYVD